MFPNNAQLINTNRWLIIPDHNFEEKLANHNNNQLYIIINNYKYESSLKLELQTGQGPLTHTLCPRSLLQQLVFTKPGPNW